MLGRRFHLGALAVDQIGGSWSVLSFLGGELLSMNHSGRLVSTFVRRPFVTCGRWLLSGIRRSDRKVFLDIETKETSE